MRFRDRPARRAFPRAAPGGRSPCHSGDSKCSNHLCPDCDHTQK
jgi:hypothetical protein